MISDDMTCQQSASISNGVVTCQIDSRSYVIPNCKDPRGGAGSQFATTWPSWVSFSFHQAQLGAVSFWVTMRPICPLSIHDQSISGADVLLNLTLFPPKQTIIPGNVLQLAALGQSIHPSGSLQANHYNGLQTQIENLQVQATIPTGTTGNDGDELEYQVDPKKGYYFVAKEMDLEISSKLVGVQVSYHSITIRLSQQHELTCT